MSSVESLALRSRKIFGNLLQWVFLEAVFPKVLVSRSSAVLCERHLSNQKDRPSKRQAHTCLGENPTSAGGQNRASARKARRTGATSLQAQFLFGRNVVLLAENISFFAWTLLRILDPLHPLSQNLALLAFGKWEEACFKPV